MAPATDSVPAALEASNDAAVSKALPPEWVLEMARQAPNSTSAKDVPDANAASSLHGSSAVRGGVCAGRIRFGANDKKIPDEHQQGQDDTAASPIPAKGMSGGAITPARDDSIQPSSSVDSESSVHAAGSVVKGGKKQRRRFYDASWSCHDCGRDSTPVRRMGPAGPRSLCNACGLRRSKKKKLEASGAKRVGGASVRPASLSTTASAKAVKAKSKSRKRTAAETSRPQPTATNVLLRRRSVSSSSNRPSPDQGAGPGARDMSSGNIDLQPAGLSSTPHQLPSEPAKWLFCPSPAECQEVEDVPTAAPTSDPPVSHAMSRLDEETQSPRSLDGLQAQLDEDEQSPLKLLDGVPSGHSGHPVQAHSSALGTPRTFLSSSDDAMADIDSDCSGPSDAPIVRLTRVIDDMLCPPDLHLSQGMAGACDGSCHESEKDVHVPCVDGQVSMGSEPSFLPSTPVSEGFGWDLSPVCVPEFDCRRQAVDAFNSLCPEFDEGSGAAEQPCDDIAGTSHAMPWPGTREILFHTSPCQSTLNAPDMDTDLSPLAPYAPDPVPHGFLFSPEMYPESAQLYRCSL